MTIEGNEVEWDESFRNFAEFLHSVSTTAAGMTVTCLEVPLDLFVTCQQQGALLSLEIAVDDAGEHFLMGVVQSSEYQAMLVSVSFSPIEREIEEEEEEESWPGMDVGGEVMTGDDPRLN